MGHLLGYARVSTSDQDARLQADALEAAGCDRIFTDHTSGALDERPELGRLLDQVLAGDTIVVWRLDRLGRSLRHLIDTITALADQGVGFRSLTENIDTTTPTGKLVFHIFGAIAEFERELNRERTKAGLAAARARGRSGGRPTVMTPDKIATARRMYETGEYTVQAIADVVGVGRATIYRHLTPRTEPPEQAATVTETKRPASKSTPNVKPPEKKPGTPPSDATIVVTSVGGRRRWHWTVYVDVPNPEEGYPDVERPSRWVPRLTNDTTYRLARTRGVADWHRLGTDLYELATGHRNLSEGRALGEQLQTDHLGLAAWRIPISRITNE